MSSDSEKVMRRIIVVVLIFAILLPTACTKADDEAEQQAMTMDEMEQAETNDDTAADTDEAENDDDTFPPEQAPSEREEEQQTEVDTPKTDDSSEDETADSPDETTEETPADMPYDENATPLSSFEYYINEREGWASIERFKGRETDVVISNYIEGYPVKILNTECFTESNIVSVTIPENVTEICSDAFSLCEQLKAVTIKSKDLVIHNDAFRACFELESIDFPEGLTEIGAHAFQYCNALKSVVLPEGLTKVGESAFGNCKSLRTLSIPSTLNSYGEAAFGGSPLENITIADGVETLGSSSCFVGALGVEPPGEIKSVTIPASVKTIGAYSFHKNLKEIVFLGDAPACDPEGKSMFVGADPIIKYKRGTKGWDDPRFAEYTLVEFE